MDDQRNWAGNLTYQARRLVEPESLEQLQEFVAGTDRIRPLGTRHSFNDIADTPGDLVSVQRLTRPVVINSQSRTASVAAGTRYGELAVQLDSAGFALPNLGSLPHISVAGACSTGTHGSGNTNGNLATAVCGIDFIAGDGELVSLTRDADPSSFCGSVVALGALGVITSMTLDLIPRYEVSQHVYLKVPYALVDAHFDEIFASSYSVSLFDDYRGEEFTQLWLKRRDDDSADSSNPVGGFQQHLRVGLEPLAATTNQHPVGGQDPSTATLQLGARGPWHFRLPHFRLDSVPSAGEEVQSEYFVPREHAVAALQALRPLSELLAPLLLVGEVRSIAADDLWLSPAYQRDSVAFHFTWVDDWTAVRPVLPLIEAALEPFEPRPHWGKLFTMDPALVAGLYPRMADFRQLVNRYDPTEKFRNQFLRTYVR
jgi:xylitol oxidase